MNDDRRIKVLLEALRRFLSRIGSQAWSIVANEFGAKENVALTEGLYFRVERAGFALVSVGSSESQSMKLSVDEAKQIFSSIGSACSSRGLVELQVGELSWMTDARPNPDPKKVIIKFIGPLGSTREIAKRKDAIAAVAEFNRRIDG